ncbi:MAG: hypothetical protein HY053_04520 [Proteobacteria bacterium]|nr:hypothetical protein [Pseudomonadota bacterium]
MQRQAAPGRAAPQARAEEAIPPPTNAELIKDDDALSAYKASYVAANIPPEALATFAKLDELSAKTGDRSNLPATAITRLHQRFYVEAYGGKEKVAGDLHQLMNLSPKELSEAGMKPEFIQQVIAARQKIEALAKKPFDQIPKEQALALIADKVSDGVNGPITRLAIASAKTLGMFKDGKPTLGDNDQNMTSMESWRYRAAEAYKAAGQPNDAKIIMEKGLNQDGSPNLEQGMLAAIAETHVKVAKPKQPQSAPSPAAPGQ